MLIVPPREISPARAWQPDSRRVAANVTINFPPQIGFLMPEAVIEHLRQVAEEGRRNAPPGLEEHFAELAAMEAYLEMREVRSDLARLGLLTAS